MGADRYASGVLSEDINLVLAAILRGAEGKTLQYIEKNIELYRSGILKNVTQDEIKSSWEVLIKLEADRLKGVKNRGNVDNGNKTPGITSGFISYNSVAKE